MKFTLTTSTTQKTKNQMKWSLLETNNLSSLKSSCLEFNSSHDFDNYIKEALVVTSH